MENNVLRILLIEDQPEFTGRIREMLNEAKGTAFELESFDNFEAGLVALIGGGIDLGCVLGNGAFEVQNLDPLDRPGGQRGRRGRSGVARWPAG